MIFLSRFEILSNIIISKFQLSRPTADYVKTVTEFARLLDWRIHIIPSLDYPKTKHADILQRVSSRPEVECTDFISPATTNGCQLILAEVNLSLIFWSILKKMCSCSRGQDLRVKHPETQFRACWEKFDLFGFQNGCGHSRAPKGTWCLRTFQKVWSWTLPD